VICPPCAANSGALRERAHSGVSTRRQRTGKIAISVRTRPVSNRGLLYRNLPRGERSGPIHRIDGRHDAARTNTPRNHRIVIRVCQMGAGSAVRLVSITTRVNAVMLPSSRRAAFMEGRGEIVRILQHRHPV